MDDKGLSLKDSVWSQIDRKAGAIIELTIRQLRHRLSTWVVLGVGFLIMILLLAFYIDSVRDGFESIDNDGDSVDEDEDGYPLGQEIKYGHSDLDSSQYPGVGKYVPVGEIDYNDNFRNISGKHGGFQREFKVYLREGSKCKRTNCFGIIKKKNISNRSTFFCNFCQK